MKELKFRAWDGKQYTNSDEYRYNKTECTYIDILATFFDDVRGCKIEQFTGLQDKNGVDIYEGDILIDHRWPTLMFIVQYDYGCFYGSGVNDDMEIDPLNDPIEIIGNINENPDLLEANQ